MYSVIPPTHTHTHTGTRTHTRSQVLLLLRGCLFCLISDQHNFLVLITSPNVQHTEPGEINRQRSPNSFSSPLELTQIGEISL